MPKISSYSLKITPIGADFILGSDSENSNDTVSIQLSDIVNISHTHAISDVTSLQATLDLKAIDSEIATVGKTGSYLDLLNIPTEFTPSSHTHVEADVTDLDKYTQAEADALLATKEAVISKAGNASKFLQINSGEDGYDFVDITSNVTYNLSFEATKTFYDSATFKNKITSFYFAEGTLSSLILNIAKVDSGDTCTLYVDEADGTNLSSHVITNTDADTFVTLSLTSPASAMNIDVSIVNDNNVTVKEIYIT